MMMGLPTTTKTKQKNKPTAYVKNSIPPTHYVYYEATVALLVFTNWKHLENMLKKTETIMNSRWVRYVAKQP